MDVTFVLEESGVTATVEVPCEADVAAAKEVACTALAVSPASVEMRIGTQVLEGTCRLQDTAFDAGVQVVLARPRLADIRVARSPASVLLSTHASECLSTIFAHSRCLLVERSVSISSKAIQPRTEGYSSPSLTLKPSSWCSSLKSTTESIASAN